MHPTRRRKIGLPVALAAALLGVARIHDAAAQAAASKTPLSAEVEIALLGAVFRGAAPEDGVQNLFLYTEVESDRWTWVWGLAHDCSKGLHYGLMRKASGGAGRLVLDIEMKIGNDPWGRGGRGAYAIELNRGPDGRLDGAFAGTYKGRKVSGRAAGTLRPPRPVMVTDFKPVQPGEHPRMLFRKHDLPALREKLKTPFGQAYLAKARQSGDLVSLGMLYQLAGDKAAAEQAMRAIEAFKGDVDPNPAGSGSTGHRLAEVSFAYDLCYDAWPEEFRKTVADGLLDRIKHRQIRLHPGHANYHPCSNYYGPSHGSSGLASLAIWREKGPEPREPESPFNANESSGRVAPASGDAPGKGVPVAKFESDAMPAEWLFAGGFKPTPGEDPLAALGGAAKARPESGAAITCGDRTDAFRPIPHEADKGYWSHPIWTKGRPAIDITGAINRIYHSTSYFYTAIDNDRPRWARVVTDYDPAVVHLAGVRLRHDDLVRLEKGLYPLLIVAPIGEAPASSRVLMRPRLIELGDEEAQAVVDNRTAAYRFERDLWKADREAWDKSGGEDPAKDFYRHAAWVRCYWHYRLGMGDGGFQAEAGPAYPNIGAWYPVVYATAHRKVFGRDASDHPDVTHLVPRRMMQSVFHDDGSQLYQMVNSGTGFDIGWAYSAVAFPVVPDAYKPSVLWAWNRVNGVAGAAAAEKVLPAVPPKSEHGPGLVLAHAFVHYPLEMAPVHPSKGMPLAWEASDFGFYCFRSGWEGKDEFIGQVFLKAKPVVGWNHGNAGTLRLLGLGHEWVAGSISRNGVRAQEPVVWLREDAIHEDGNGQLIFLKTEKDGSATLGIDLDDVHRPADAKPDLHDRNLVRQADRLAGPITAMRAVAFDYSGASGAPCLLAIVDKVQGGKSKEWLWPLPGEASGKGKAAAKGEPAARVGKNTFTFDYGDASLTATFLAPPTVTLEAGTESLKAGPDARHGFEGAVRRVKATGGDAFFVVMTVQRGAAPAAAIEGTGLDAVATIGRQTVRFDGRAIVLKPEK